MTRVSKLHMLNTKYMAVETDRVVFKRANRPKRTRKMGIRGIFVPSENYLSRTEEWRKENIESKPCLSFINQHRAVTTSTIARWVKTAFYCRGEYIQESTLLIQSGQHLLSMKID